MKIRNCLLKAIVILMSILLLLTGCSSGDPLDAGETTEPETTASTESETKKPSGSSGSSDRDWIKFRNPWETGIEVKAADGETITLRRVTIDIDGDKEIKIYQITDVHFNYMNAQDQQDATIVASSKAWEGIGDNAPIVESFQRCVTYAGNNQIVVTGDMANFYSHGNMELIQRYIFDPANIMAVVGNHDATMAGYPKERIQANMDELSNMFLDDGQSMSYFSKVLDGRVMLIQMDNAAGNDIGASRFSEAQKTALEADLATARAKGYAVLLFYHIPLPSKNTNDGMKDYDLGMYTYAGASKDVYDLITNNADIIKGCFAGHTHADSYSDIMAKTADGKKAVIPQYVLSALYLGTGDMVEIVIK